MKQVAVLALAGSLVSHVGCNAALEPTPLPAGAWQFAPEAVFRAWWRQIELCSGRSGSYDAVRWFAVPGEEPFHVKNHEGPVVGYWDPAANRIVLLQYLPERRAPVIRHEALHALIQRFDHPKAYFVDRCGDVIDGPENPDEAATGG